MNPPSRWMPWLLIVVMAIVGVAMPSLGPRFFGLSPTDNAVLSGSLGGALIGAAGAMLALLIMDWRQQAAAEQARQQRQGNAEKLIITAELVNVAMGMITTKKTMDIAIGTAEQGVILPDEQNFERDMPRNMPLTDALAAELLILTADALDALVTLKSNIERTGEGLREISSGRRSFGLLAARQISTSLAHDMIILAECFDHLAPTRKFKMHKDSEPRMASAVLRDYASRSIANEKMGA